MHTSITRIRGVPLYLISTIDVLRFCGLVGYHSGRVPHWKGVTVEGCHIGRVSHWKGVTVEGCHSGRVPQWKGVTGRVSLWKGVTVKGCHFGRVSHSLGGGSGVICVWHSSVVQQVLSLNYILCY